MNDLRFCPRNTFKARAFARPDVRRKYEELKEEFELLSEILKERTEARLK